MKVIKYLSAVILLLPFLSSCHDYDYDNIVASGNPVIKASVPASAMMGDSIDVVYLPNWVITACWPSWTMKMPVPIQITKAIPAISPAPMPALRISG